MDGKRSTARSSETPAGQSATEAEVPLLSGDHVDFPERSEEEAEFRAELEEALREADEGAFIPNEEIVAWLESMGTENPLPKPTARKLR